VTLSLDRHTIFLSLAGSQAHGTERESSDVDLRGICVAPLDVRLSLAVPFEQYEGPLQGELAAAVRPRLETHPTACRGLAVRTECVIFDAAKFLALCAAANPNALEILFVEEQDWLYEKPAWRRVHDHRHRFLTRKVQHTFLGYALAQLKKIRTHREWLLHPPAHKPTRQDFGLPAAESVLSRDDQNRIEQSMAEKVRSYGIHDLELPRASRLALQERLDSFVRDVLACPEEEVEDRMRAIATRALGLPVDVVAALNGEKKYRAALKQWDAFQAWQLQRNPGRAELERRHGYDTKHAMHLVRLMRMGVEALAQGELHVRRSDHAELSAIRDGTLSFDELERMAAALQVDMGRAATTTKLPDDVDPTWVDRLAFSLMTGEQP
jgi:predicted nucleotidyltransferase